MSKIEKSILQTLAFYDIFNRPLMLEELWRFLYKNPASKLQVLMGVKKLLEKRLIFKKNNYYFLAANKKIIKDYLRLRPHNRRLWQKVFWVMKILKFAPFVKNISIINSLSFAVANEESDIDIMVISKKNRLWTARAFVILLLEIIGQNKNRWHRAGKFCLGFAYDETRLNLRTVLPKKYLYSAFWLGNFTPVLDRKMYQRLIAENPWIYEELPNWTPEETSNYSAKNSRFEKLLSGKLGERLENWLAEVQIKRVWADPENIKGLKGLVIADSHMLKMHPKDMRPEYQRRWLDLMLRHRSASTLSKVEGLTKKRFLR